MTTSLLLTAKISDIIFFFSLLGILNLPHYPLAPLFEGKKMRKKPSI
jgi:hypothetical protein